MPLVFAEKTDSKQKKSFPSHDYVMEMIDQILSFEEVSWERTNV